jgi:hypothetical protein
MKYKGNKLSEGPRRIVRVHAFHALNNIGKSGGFPTFRRRGKYALGKLTAEEHKILEATKVNVLYRMNHARHGVVKDAQDKVKLQGG